LPRAVSTRRSGVSIDGRIDPQGGTLTKPTLSPASKPCHAAALEGISEEVCQAIADVLTRVGDKWSLFVLHALSQRSMRFNELKRSLGTVSQKVLTATLRGLERDGYVAREVTPSVPPRVDYHLTDLGREVLVPVAALAMWVLSRKDALLAARASFDKRDRRRAVEPPPQALTPLASAPRLAASWSPSGRTG
jgi:DNA-binding HxlR family transcriptional regulator